MEMEMMAMEVEMAMGSEGESEGRGRGRGGGTTGGGGVMVKSPMGWIVRRACDRAACCLCLSSSSRMMPMIRLRRPAMG
jgi:hypothetical protein